MRKKNRNFDRDYLGEAIERLTRQLLLKRNIVSRTGHYWVGKTRWECDLVVETPEIIILIEVKKKPLTRRARAGSDISLLIDLAQSLLDAQKQAGNHEMQLRKAGFIKLISEEGTHRIEVKGRNFERIALSFTDFGSFHDRTFLEKFLNAAIGLKFNVLDLRYDKQIADLNSVIETLQFQQRSLYADGGKQTRPYFNCWFFSLPQLMVMLDEVTDAEGLRDALWATRGISNNHGDLYFNLHYAKTLKANDPEWFAMIQQMANLNKTFVTGG